MTRERLRRSLPWIAVGVVTANMLASGVTAVVIQRERAERIRSTEEAIGRIAAEERALADIVGEVAEVTLSDSRATVLSCQRGNALRAAVTEIAPSSAARWEIGVVGCRRAAIAAGGPDPGPVRDFPPGVEAP